MVWSSKDSDYTKAQAGKGGQVALQKCAWIEIAVDLDGRPLTLRGQRSLLIKPENRIEIKNAIILLHGYGGDGKDISMVSLNWKRYMPNTVFICPDGHEVCSINPSGYQWFDLTKDDPDYILEETIKAENIIKKFISEIKQEFNLTNNKICL